MEIGVIGGTGILLFGGKEKKVKTPYGNASVNIAEVKGNEIGFIQRHGKGHSIPPHKINHKANIYAFYKMGVKNIFGISACGIIDRYAPGDIILLEDFIGTYLGPITFFESFKKGIFHTDFIEPYSIELRNILKKAAEKERIRIKEGGIVATTFGPRFETKAEICALRKMCVNLVSMTAAYEVILAREIGINYAGIAIGTNYACGFAKKPLSHEEVEEMMKRKGEEIMKLLTSALTIFK